MRRYFSRVASLAQQLEARSKTVMIVQLPEAGRSLVAAEDIPAGTIIHRELPMLATPSPAASVSTCYSCLKPLAALPTSTPQSPYRFCSDDCKDHADLSWMKVESHCDFSALRTACIEKAEKFPLMAARLACMTLQRDLESKVKTEVASTNNVSDVLLRGDPLRDLGNLCFANVPEPPADWAQMHSLLLQGLSGVADAQVLANKFDLKQWYCWVLSRLHLNVFRVDTVPPLDPADPAALFKAAAAAVSGGAQPTSSQGSAVYLLASMFNHSCAPNVDVVFPENNAAVAFMAMTDIPKYTELCISYIDSEAGRATRQEELRFAYGFRCKCPRCIEEAA